MIKPETKLKKHAGVVLKALSKFPKDKVPTLENGGLDVQAFNNLPEIVKVKTDLIKSSIEILGKNVISREWFQDNGFIVAGMVLNFTNENREFPVNKNPDLCNFCELPLSKGNINERCHCD